MSKIANLIEITSLPHGDAPEAVRRGWIGCVIPCEPECGHVPVYTESVLARKKAGLWAADEWLKHLRVEKIDGFSVPQDIALQVLAVHSPLAAKWFDQHGYPKKNQCFRFKLAETKVFRTLSAGEESKLGKMVIYDDMETGTMRPMNI